MAHLRDAITSGDLTDLVSSGASATVYPSEDTVLQVLQARFRGDLPYARAGATTYVVVNPLKTLANLNDASAKEYEERCYKDTTLFPTADMPRPLQPHVYDLAARMYLMMQRRGESQVLVSQGVTGSGKSMAQKLVIDQLLRFSATRKKENKIAIQIRAFNTLLDSFGNAKSILTPNATRHSRYFEIHFNNKGRVCGAKVLAYGLDKSRLVHLAKEERTYHVFYQLLAGASGEEQDHLNLEDPSEYALLASSGCYRLPGGPFSDDSVAMGELRAAMAALGFKAKHLQSIFHLLVAILLLGNLTFNEAPGREESATVANPLVLAAAARHLGVSTEDLEYNLTNRTSYIKKDLFSVFLSAEQAREQRDNMIQSLYSILFAFVVETANHKIASVSDPATIISFLDLPGAQGKAQTAGSTSSGGIQPLIAAQGHSTFDDFYTNFSNELVHSFILRNTFDDSVGFNSQATADGITFPAISTMENSGCVELLKGVSVPERVQKKPEGLLGVLHKSTTSVKSGKATQGSAKDEEMITDLVSKFGTHTSFITSPTLGQPGAGVLEKNLFGINHYSGGCTYDASHFLDRNADMLDPAIVSMLRDSHDTFVAKVFSGPSIASEKHPKDESVLVQTQVSSRPLRQQSELPMAGETSSTLSNVPHLDSGKPYPVTTQINYTLSSILYTVQSARLWTMSCIRPNDSGSSNSFDKKRVKFQIRALLLPDVIARRKIEYVADYDKTAFCDRYAPTMQGTIDERLRQCIRSNGWKNNMDYRLGHRSIWLTYSAWKMAEDILRDKEALTAGLGLDDAESAAPEGESEYGAEPPNPFKHRYMDSQDRLVDSEAGHSVNNPFSNSYAGGGLRSPMMHSEVDGQGEGWVGSDWDKKDLADSALAGKELEKNSGSVHQNELLGNTVEEIPTSRSRRWWLRLTWLFTWWIPNWTLTHIGRMKRPDVRLAWREKLTICVLIFLMCALVIFYIIFFGRLLCPEFNKAWESNEVAQHTGQNDFWVSLHGQVYDISKFWRSDHSDIPNLPVTRATMEQLAGQDLTDYFPPPLLLGCSGLVTDPTVVMRYANFTPIDITAIHTSGYQQPDIQSKLRNDNWYVQNFLPTLREFHKGPLVWNKKVVNQLGTNGTLTWAIWDDGVYDLTDYFYTISQNVNAKDTLAYMNESVTDLFQRQPGQDISQQLNEVFATMDPLLAKQHNACLKNVFLVGQTDFRKTARCQVQNGLLLAFSVLLVTTIAAKFLSALQLTSKRSPEMQDKFVICQVPCYTEGEESLRRTIDSLAALKYDDKRKLMFIICDGNIIGSGNDRPTPRIVLDILGVDPKLDPEPLMFKSVGEGSQQLNYGKVYSGLYEFEGHVVPYMVVVKVGRPTERSKPGNRGKRDSQILLMHYLNRVHFDAPMSPLELEIYHQMRNVIGIDPAFYEYIFTVDADTIVTPESLNRLVSCAADDSKVIGICGETKVDNEEGSWWTMIQVYEYYISHHLAKAFESLFGSVTCLPGCFSVYRIRTADKGRPIIISNRIIDEYAENHVDTLHKKNLFSLGEDRYLTTLLMKNFPTYKLKFTPDAVAHTVAPERWSILLSQRRRWINSTIHNLCELVFLPELCGFCCFSMRFIVFLDLLGTIILPATTVYLVYLIVITSTGKAAIPILSLVMIGAVYGLQAVIFILKREFMLVGWMVVYILSYPVYSFFLPIYSFWCMDDFSWGNTRLVVGEGNSKKVIMNDDSKFDETVIPLKKFSEYEAEAWEGTIAQDEGQTEDSKSIAPSRRSGVRAPHAESLHSYHASTNAGDYYRDTNLTNNSSANPNVRHQPSLPNMSQYGGMMPAFGNGPPSVVGSMVMPPSMAFPQTNSMFMGSMGLPQVPRGSVMTNLGMFGGAGSATGRVSAFGMAPRMSTFSMATNLNPFAGETDPNPNPTDEGIAAVLRGYLSTQDLMTVTKKTAREAVMKHFPQADLANKRELLNRLIDEILATT